MHSSACKLQISILLCDFVVKFAVDCITHSPMQRTLSEPILMTIGEHTEREVDKYKYRHEHRCDVFPFSLDECVCVLYYFLTVCHSFKLVERFTIHNSQFSRFYFNFCIILGLCGRCVHAIHGTFFLTLERHATADSVLQEHPRFGNTKERYSSLHTAHGGSHPPTFSSPRWPASLEHV